MVVPLEDGWEKIRTEGINVLENFLDTGMIRTGVTQPADETKPRNVFSRANYAELYTTVYNMCTQRTPHNWSEQLYKRYGDAMSSYVTRMVLPALKEKRGIDLLRELLLRWQNHKIYVKWMDRFFSYLDRYYVKLQSVDPLGTKGYSIFQTHIFDQVRKDTRKAILDLITAERRGEVIDHELVKGVIEMFLDLGMGQLEVYVQSFEDDFLPNSSEYFVRQASGWLSEDSFPEYMRKAEEALQAEEQRVENYLHRSTGPKLKHVVIRALLQQQQIKLMEKSTAVVYLLENNKSSDLSRLHRLFSLVDGGLGPVALCFRNYVAERGNAIVDERVMQLKTATKQEALGAPQFVQTLIDLHDRFKSIVVECFGKDSLFQKSLKEAFEIFVNRDIGRYSFAALMCAFCDRILKKSGERLAEDQVEALLTKCVELFSFLTDKDLFAEIYKNQLSKRLLYETSASEDAEKSMIAKLKMNCGAQFTSKLEGMITDLSLASEWQRKFITHQEKLTDRPKIEFNVVVLTTGYWPSYQATDANLTPEMQRCLGLFQEFYAAGTEHRRLQWIHSLGQATVSAKINNRRHDLIVNTYQALILLLFNGEEDLDVSTIHQSIGQTDIGLTKKLLQTLWCAKYKILNKMSNFDPSEKGIADNETFNVNHTFTCPHRKIKIPPPSSEETHNKERVEEDRSIAIEAAIVRIMKARKHLTHQQLVSEVLTQLAFFKPNPKVIKQRIEHLIEREYLERDPTQQASVYRYLA